MTGRTIRSPRSPTTATTSNRPHELTALTIDTITSAHSSLTSPHLTRLTAFREHLTRRLKHPIATQTTTNHSFSASTVPAAQTQTAPALQRCIPTTQHHCSSTSCHRHPIGMSGTSIDSSISFDPYATTSFDASQLVS